MIIKEREAPHALKIMEALNNRMRLTQQQKNYFANLVKGLDGERRFDALIGDLPCEHIYIQDLTLKVNRTIFQVDSLLITRKAIHIYEVKNYEGEYILQSNKLVNCTTNKEILNPAIQLERSSTLMRQFLDERGISMKLEGHVVFVNPEFILYQSNRNQRYILPGMLRRHANDLNKEVGELSNLHRKCADVLCSENLLETPYSDLPEYTFDSLRKGILCHRCSAEINDLTGRLFICKACGYRETAQRSVLRHIREYLLLFSDSKLSTGVIHEWCDRTPSRYTIRTVLNKNFQARRSGRWKEYI